MDVQLPDSHALAEPFRVGAVSFFNARPLTFSLEQHPAVSLSRAAPAQLADSLDAGRLDVALVPSIDYQLRPSDWLILPFGAVVSRGPVLTVQVFSRRPIDTLETIACDTDSHSSVVLAQIIWQLRFQRPLTVKPLRGPPQDESAVLLIGDKVLTQLDRWPHHCDLGQAWHDLTSLPFVYAFWAAPAQRCPKPLLDIMHQAHTDPWDNLDPVINHHAAEHGFSLDLARSYLTENIRFEFGPAEQQGLRRFFSLAQRFGLIAENRPLRFCRPPTCQLPLGYL